MKCVCAAYVDSRKKHFEPSHDKTNKITFVTSEDSNQPETTSENIAYGIVTNLHMRN